MCAHTADASGECKTPDPVLERAERAINILDDFILKSARSARGHDPVMHRAERGMCMCLSVCFYVFVRLRVCMCMCLSVCCYVSVVLRVCVCVC